MSGRLLDLRYDLLESTTSDLILMASCLLPSFTHQGHLLWRTIANYLYQDDFLGSAEIDLGTLKEPGVHTFELELENGKGSTEDGMTVTFSAEFMTFQGTKHLLTFLT